VIGEDAGCFVSKLDRDIQNGVARVAQVTETAQDFCGNEQSFWRAELCGVQVPINAYDGDPRLHAEIEGARVPMRLVEKILYGYGELARELYQPIPQRLDDIVGQRISLHSLDPLSESIGLVVEMVEDDLLQSETPQLCDRIELGRMEGDVRDQGERWVPLEQAGYRADVHDPVGGRVENYDTDGLPADYGFKLLPGRGNEKLRLISKDMLDVSEQPRWQKRRNAQMAIALMILGNWWERLSGARANDKKSTVFGRKQTFSDKKTTFRRFQVGVRLPCSVPPTPLASLNQEFFK
jgi:hypothetical protein